MKQTKHILLTIATLLCSLTASAEDFVVNGIYYNITSSTNKTVEVTFQGFISSSYDEYKGSVVIPSRVSYGGSEYRVTSIGNSAFNGCSGLTSITIPENSQLTSIGSYAFYDCSSLTTITIPASVTSIGSSAFEYCSSLTSITIPENSQLTSIGSSAFDNCSSLTSITIPENSQLTSIGRYAFYGCSSLTTITIPEGVTSIRDYAFRGCSSLTSITIPEGVTSIGDYAFEYCRSLTAITCEATTPPTVGGSYTFNDVDKSIPVYVPAGSVEAYQSAEYWKEFTDINGVVASGTCGDNLTWKLTEEYELVIEGTGDMYDYSSESAPWYEYRESIQTITMGEGVTSIGSSVFYNCKKLTSITIPEGVTSIGSSAFYRCTSLASITLPEGVTRIEDNAFRGCSSLTSITIPESVTSIGSQAFSGCSGITNMYCYADNVPSVEGNPFDNSLLENATLSVPENVLANYQSTAPWSSFATIMGLGIVPEQEFSNEKVYTLRSTRAFLLYSEVEDINHTLCTNTGVRVGTVKYSLTEPNLQFSIKQHGDNYYLYSIGAGKYVGASGAYEETPNTVLSMQYVGGDYPWKLVLGGKGMNSQVPNQTNTGIMINDWLKTDAGNCYQITEAKKILSSGTCGDNLTWRLTEEYELVIEGTGDMYGYPLETTPWYEYRESIQTITLHASVTSIGWYAFSGCSNLTAITIPEGVTSIGRYAFSGCSNLTAITIPESVTSIGESAFAYCHSLTTITIPEGVTGIGSDAFSWCSSLTTITIPASVTSIGSSAFFYCSSLTTITIHASVTSIGSQAFSNCSSLTTITIPASVTSIGSSAFSNCSNLATITIPENSQLTSIGSSAFDNCSSLTSITIPENSQLTSIGRYAFYGCSSLTTITIPESVTSIGDYAFEYCRSLTAITCEATTPPTVGGSYTFIDVDKSIPVYVPAGSVEAYKAAAYWSEFANYQPLSSDIASGTCGDNLTWKLTEEYELVIEGTGDMYDYSSESAPWYEYRESIQTITMGEGVTSIGSDAFSWCSSLTTITIPASVTSIGSQAFSNCSSLTSITIPEGMTSIGDWAFYDCTSLTAITIPESVTSIEDNAFSGCSLTSITCEATTPPTVGGSYTFIDVDKSIPVYVPAGSVEAYKAAAYWSEFANFLALPTYVADITLSQSEVMLTEGETLTLTGLPEGTEVAVYDTSGTSLAAATAENGTATLTTNLTTGSTAIVKIGGHSVKVVVK